MLCYSMLFYAMLCYAMLCYATPFYAMLYYAVTSIRSITVVRPDKVHCQKEMIRDECVDEKDDNTLQ